MSGTTANDHAERLPADIMWEHYRCDPQDEPDPGKWLTRICRSAGD